MNTSNRDKSHYDLLKYSLKAQNYIIAGAFQLVTLQFKNRACNAAALKRFLFSLSLASCPACGQLS